MSTNVLIGDALEQLRTLQTASVDCCVTSPPYYHLRDYGVGIELNPEYAELAARRICAERNDLD